MKTICTLFIIDLLLFYQAVGQPVSRCAADPNPITIKQPDGSRLTIVGKGNAHSSHTETLDGHTIIKNEKGIYEYALADPKNAYNLSPSGIKAHNPGERSVKEDSFLDPIPKHLVPKHPKVQSMYKLNRAANQPQQDAGPADGASRDINEFPSSGTHKVLLLLIKYPDLENKYGVQDFEKMMNDPGGTSGHGSFREYYQESSGGALNLETDVFGWFTAKNGYEYYGRQNGYGVSRELVREAIEAAEEAGADFSQYDNDGDGWVDALIVAHAGPGAEQGSRTQYVWSHYSGLGSNYKYYDGVYLNEYMMNPETRYSRIVDRGVFCHEFGHNLNLPDLYDTDDSSLGIGNWGLMGTGSWLNGGDSPAGLCAWSRLELGWVTPTVIGTSGNFTLNPSASSHEVYKIETSSPQEYFLLENRQKEGVDSHLPYHGLCIWHIDEGAGSNRDERRKLVDLEEADGSDDLDNKSNRGDTGDTYPGSGRMTTFSLASYPDNKLNTGELTGMEVANIYESDKVISFDLIKYYLTIKEPEISGKEGNYEFQASTNLNSFSASENEDWFSVYTNGTTLSVLAQSNPGESKRTGVITLSNDTIPDQHVTLTQAGAGFYLTVTPDSVVVGAGVHTTAYRVETNTSGFSVVNDDDWLTFTQDGHTFFASSRENTNLNPRTATITVTSDEVEDRVVWLTQLGADPYLTLSAGMIDFSEEGGEEELSVSTNLEAFEVIADASWLTATIGGSTVVISAESNTSLVSRSAEVVISGDGVEEQVISVTQSAAAPYLTLSAGMIDFSEEGGEEELSVSTNLETFEVVEDASWLTATIGGSTVVVSAESNASLVSRSAEVVIDGDGVEEQVISVTQSAAAPYLTLSAGMIDFSDEGGKEELSVSTNLKAFEVVEDASWMTATTEGSKVVVSAESNTSLVSRSAEVVIEGDGVEEQVISVTQSAAAPYLTLSAGVVDFSEEGGKEELSVSTNLEAFEVIEDASWLTATIGGSTVVISAGSNTLFVSRSAEVVIGGDGVEEQVISVTQSAATPYLTLSAEMVDFSEEGGEEEVTINTNLDSFTIHENSDWCETFMKGSAILIKVNANTTWDDRITDVVISGSGIEDQFIKVRQTSNDPYFVLSIDYLSLPHYPVDTVITVSTNAFDFSIEGNPDWISLNTNGDQIFLSIEENETIEERSAVLTLVVEGLQDQFLEVTQAGADNGGILASAELLREEIYTYPNPSNGHFTLRIGNDPDKEKRIRIYASDGALVKELLVKGIDGEFPIDIRDHLVEGVYTLQVDIAKRLYTQRVVIK